MNASILKTLVEMNWSFGKGEITALDFTAGKLTVTCPHVGQYTYKFRYNCADQTVRYRGRTRKVRSVW